MASLLPVRFDEALACISDKAAKDGLNTYDVLKLKLESVVGNTKLNAAKNFASAAYTVGTLAVNAGSMLTPASLASKALTTVLEEIYAFWEIHEAGKTLTKIDEAFDANKCACGDCEAVSEKLRHFTWSASEAGSARIDPKLRMESAIQSASSSLSNASNTLSAASAQFSSAPTIASGLKAAANTVVGAATADPRPAYAEALIKSAKPKYNVFTTDTRSRNTVRRPSLELSSSSAPTLNRSGSANSSLLSMETTSPNSLQDRFITSLESGGRERSEAISSSPTPSRGRSNALIADTQISPLRTHNVTTTEWLDEVKITKAGCPRAQSIIALLFEEYVGGGKYAKTIAAIVTLDGPGMLTMKIPAGLK